MQPTIGKKKVWIVLAKGDADLPADDALYRGLPGHGAPRWGAAPPRPGGSAGRSGAHTGSVRPAGAGDGLYAGGRACCRRPGDLL